MPVTINAYALTTIEEVLIELRHEHNSDHLDLIARAVNDMTARFQGPSGVNRNIRSQTYTHDGDVAGNNLPLLRPHDATTLVLQNPPITSITTLKVDATASALTESTDGGATNDFVIDHDRGIVYLTGTVFTYLGRPSVPCTYVGGFVDDDAAGFSAAQLERWGWVRRSADVSRACARQIAHEYRKSARGWDGIASVSEANMTMTLAPEPWLPSVLETIHNYRLPELP